MTFRFSELVLHLFRALNSQTSLLQVLNFCRHGSDFNVDMFLALPPAVIELQRVYRVLSTLIRTLHRRFPTCHQREGRSHKLPN